MVYIDAPTTTARDLPTLNDPSAPIITAKRGKWVKTDSSWDADVLCIAVTLDDAKFRLKHTTAWAYHALAALDASSLDFSQLPANVWTWRP